MLGCLYLQSGCCVALVRFRSGQSEQASTLLQAVIHVCSCVQAHNEFILPLEKEGFIHRMRDIIRRAEALMRREPLEPLGPANVLRLPYLSGEGTLSGSQVRSRSFRTARYLTLTIRTKTLIIFL